MNTFVISIFNILCNYLVCLLVVLFILACIQWIIGILKINVILSKKLIIFSWIIIPILLTISFTYSNQIQRDKIDSIPIEYHGIYHGTNSYDETTISISSNVIKIKRADSSVDKELKVNNLYRVSSANFIAFENLYENTDVTNWYFKYYTDSKGLAISDDVEFGDMFIFSYRNRTSLKSY